MRCLAFFLSLALVAACAPYRGTPAPGAFDVDGVWVEPLDEEGLVVWLFLDTECPIANVYSPEVERIVADYAPRGVEFFLVYADADRSPEDVRRHREEYGLTPPSLIDHGHSLVRYSGASVTPEAAVFRGPERLYLGRIDDRYADYGKQRVVPTRRDLRLALDAALEGARPEVATTEAIGCFIPDPPTELER